MRLSSLDHFPPRPARFAFIQKLGDHLRHLPPGDKLVVGILAALLALLLFAGLYAVERQFLVEVPSRGGSLREGVVGAARFVNPLLALSDADRDLASLTYAGLMGHGADGSLVPVIAESYEVSEDGKTYTFRIRENAKFSDGTPITAEDVVFTVMKAQDPGLKSPERANWANVLVESVDSRTVRFTLPKSYAPFLSDATLGILPAHLWKSISDEGFPFAKLMEEPVAAGPFVVDRIERGKDGEIKRYRLRANDRYALGRPYLSSMDFVFYETEEELSEALLRGTVESAYGIPSKHAVRLPYSRVIAVFFNPSQNPLFQRIEVRKALSVAIGRDALVAGALGGYGVPVDGPVPPGGVADVAPASNIPDPVAEARDILERNDWEFDEEEGVWKLASEKLTLSFTMRTSNVPELKTVAESVKAEWAKLGVPVAIELYDPSELAATVIRPRSYDALLFGMVVGRDRDLFAFWDSSQRTDPGLNIAQYANRAVDDLLEKIRAERDPEIAAASIQEADELIAADYPAAFLYAPEFVYSVPDGLHGLSLARVAAPSDRLLGARFWYRRTEFVWPVFAPPGYTGE